MLIIVSRGKSTVFLMEFLILCLSELKAKAGLFGEGLQKLPGDSFQVLMTIKWCINAVS